jgi:hypothetical protein
MFLNEVVELGGDEGLELAKVMVLRAGEAGNCWNDQPWFFTQILSLALAFCGDHILVPRILVALLALGMLCAAAWLAFGRVRVLTVLPVTGFWMLSPHILDVNISAMVEIPAFALMTMAMAFARFGSESGRWPPLAASGVLTGMACQIKLVAAMYGPALVLVVVVGSLQSWIPDGRPIHAEVPPGRLWRLARHLGWLSSFAALTFVVILVCAPSWRWDLLWEHHARASSSNPVSVDHNYEFTWRYLWYHEEALIGAALGIACLVLRRQWTALAGLAAMLLVSIGIHLNYKPYWYYYYVHIAIPASALSAYGLVSCLEVILRRGGLLFQRRPGVVAAGAIAGVALVVTAAGVFGVPRFRTQWQALQLVERLQDSPLMAAIRTHSPSHSTLFSRRPILYFHSRLAPIPDLALLVKKRFWSGDLSEQSLVTKIIAGKPDLLHLDRRHYPPTSPINAFLQGGYTMVWNQDADEVWVRKRALTVHP